MQIVKGDGTRVPYDEERVRLNLTRATATPEIAQKVLNEIRPKITEGMTTRALHDLVKETLRKHSVCVACRYNLRDAVLRLGPAGFNFEFFIAEILRAHGYDAKVPPGMLKGACVDHEVDVIAEKDGCSMFIEAKFRNTKMDVVGLKDAMATWTRFLDLVDGAALGHTEHFDECVIITNARFTATVKQFSSCKGIRLIGWDYPKEFNFPSMIDQRALYPVTVIDDFTEDEVGALAKSGLLLCKNVEVLEPEELSGRIHVSVTRATEMIHLASRVVHGD